MAYRDEEKRTELERIAAFLGSVEIPAQVLAKGPYVPESSLLICLPSAEEFAEELTEENAQELLHMATGNLVDVGEAGSPIAKYLSLYSQIRADLAGLEELDILRLINEMNRAIPVGHFFYGEENGQMMIQYRAAIMGDAAEPFEEGIVANAILEMGIGYDRMKEAVEERRRGK